MKDKRSRCHDHKDGGRCIFALGGAFFASLAEALSDDFQDGGRAALGGGGYFSHFTQSGDGLNCLVSREEGAVK